MCIVGSETDEKVNDAEHHDDATNIADIVPSGGSGSESTKLLQIAAA